MVLQTKFGDLELGFFPDVAPETTAHILEAFRLGLYDGNEFFRVDRGFVAQLQDARTGRAVPLNAEQAEVADVKVRGEFSDLRHVRGTLSMARYDDPNSATTSFSVLLGDAPHLDGQYAVFGRMTAGEETLAKLEAVQTRKEGIFVMPKERISVISTYFRHGGKAGVGAGAGAGAGAAGGGDTERARKAEASLKEMQERYRAQEVELQRVRAKCLPGG